MVCGTVSGACAVIDHDTGSVIRSDVTSGIGATVWRCRALPCTGVTRAGCRRDGRRARPLLAAALPRVVCQRLLAGTRSTLHVCHGALEGEACARARAGPSWPTRNPAPATAAAGRLAVVDRLRRVQRAHLDSREFHRRGTPKGRTAWPPQSGGSIRSSRLTPVHAQFIIASGYSPSVTLYDLRTSQAVRTYAGIHRDHINITRFVVPMPKPARPPDAHACLTPTQPSARPPRPPDMQRSGLRI